ncbi:hypothetical protein JK628_01945 [Shewanella sp. KX20019]|uniref:carboxymuconolactone decarboxylase family protein n=1 Tax=Shewanella sp. KX20019 TaxID=2803864 RepID=UPI001928508B|nr:carboxymuconolactone decarboxylase family protein [Shewanella sp. KX20019]QQX80662.1 hypothetical protein JK628_01945 [Shewanella sp. KX20019]
MSTFVQFPDESEDQRLLLKSVLISENHLASSSIKTAAWAAALACRDWDVVKQVQFIVGDLSPEAKREIQYAISRMSVTNPYFFSRQFVDVHAGGNLESLKFRSFADIAVENEVDYHYACIAVSMINGGYACFKSHTMSLKTLGQSDAAIDQAMRITAAVMAARQVHFNNQVLFQG